jgi:hypothetical protein
MYVFTTMGEKINRNKWNKNRRNNYISCLKKNYPTKPLICFRKIEDNFLNYYIYDGYNRIKSIIRYLTKNKNINSQILQKQIVLEIIPEYLTEEELKIILSYIKKKEKYQKKKTKTISLHLKSFLSGRLTKYAMKRILLNYNNTKI